MCYNHPIMAVATGKSVGQGRNGAAVGYVLLAVVIFSVVPITVDLSGAAENPFLFTGGWRLGGFLGCIAFLLLRYRALLRDRDAVALVGRRIVSWAILLAVFGKFAHGLFALSTRFIDVSVAAILYETWPILMIIFTARLFQGQGRYRQVNIGVLAMLSLGFVGYAFVIVSQVGGFGAIALNFSNETIYYGLALVAVAALLGGYHNAKLFEWGTDVGHKLSRENDRQKPLHSLELFGVIAGNAVAQLLCFVPSYTIGFALGEDLTYRLLAFSIIGGILSSGLGDILWRTANLRTDNLGINALGYATPCFSLTWLFLFSRVGVALPDYLIIGGAAIVATNILINFEAEIRWGFKALVLGLGACGAVVYLRDGVFARLGLDDWQWASSGYFEALALSATIFTLILSFRVARLANRTREEDNRAFALFREMDGLVRRNVIDQAIREHILTIDAAQGPELAKAYAEARSCISVALRQAGGPDREKLIALETELDALAHSRQQAINFGELCALVIFAGITIFLALCSRPVVSGATGLLVEIFTMLFSAVIAFLTVNVWDLQRDRRSRILQGSASQPGRGYGVVFQDQRRRAFEQWISILASSAIVAAYVGLLGHKWLNWFGWLG